MQHHTSTILHTQTCTQTCVDANRHVHIHIILMQGYIHIDTHTNSKTHSSTVSHMLAYKNTQSQKHIDIHASVNTYEVRHIHKQYKHIHRYIPEGAHPDLHTINTYMQPGMH